jgi:hypothetical protein
MISVSTAGRMRLALTLLLGLLAVCAFCVRTASIAEPLGADQSLWASAARGMSHGQRLYRDVWEQRPPGIYWIYLTGFRVLGWTSATVAWLDILASATTAALLFLIARNLSNTLTGALVAALYASLTMPAWLYSHGGFLERSVCETFIATCVAFGAWSAVQVRERNSGAAAVALGLSAGAAVVLKPNAGLYFPALLLWVALYRDRGSSARLVAVAILAGAIVPALALLWLWRLDLLHDARVAVIDFNRFYVSQGFTLGGYALEFSKAVWLRIKTDPLWLAGTIGSFIALWDFARRRTLPPLAGLALILGASTVAVIVVNGARLFNSYFINAHIPLSLMAGWMLGDSWQNSRTRKVLASVTVLMMAFLIVHRGYSDRVVGWARADFDRLRGHADARTYLERFGDYGNNRGYSARANAELAQYVRGHTTSDDRIFLLGISGAGVYFASDRVAAHRFLRVNFFVDTDFPDPHFRLGSVLADLAVARPRYIIFERLHTRSRMAETADNLPNDPAVQELLRAYHLDTRIEDFTLYRRSD